MKFSILGSKIDALNSYRETYELVLNYLRTQNTPAYLTVNNVHTVTEGLRDPKFREIINNSFLALPDGKPLSVIGKWNGIKRVERIFGPTFFEKTLEWGVEENLKHYFFGSSGATLEKLKKNVENIFPGIKITGAFSPPFRDFMIEENDQFIRDINYSEPDIIWVSLGAPKQEKWIYSNFMKFKKGLIIGIGAGFDYLADNLKNAPEWMKGLSLEWTYRLMQEPERLWRRYLISNSKFIFYVTLELLGLKKFN